MSGSKKPNEILMGVHGFAGGCLDFRYLAKEMISRNDGLAVATLPRSREFDPQKLPPNVKGTGRLQVGAAGVGLALVEATSPESVTKVGAVSHSLGGPIVAELIDIVNSGNLPPVLIQYEGALIDIIEELETTMVAPAGFKEVSLFNSLFALSLGRTMLSAGVSIAKDSSSSLEELLAQRSRASDAAKYIFENPLFTICEGVDLAYIDTLDSVSRMNVNVIAYADDELFPGKDIVDSLQSLMHSNPDRAILKILYRSDPRKLIKLAMSGRAVDLTLPQVMKFISKTKEKCVAEYTDNSAEALRELGANVVTLPGNHSALLTREGSRQVADVMTLGKTALAA